MRRAFVALSWPVDCDAANAHVAALARRLEGEPAWRAAGDLPGLRVWTGAATPLAVRALPSGQGFVVGELFDHPTGAARPERSPWDVRAAARGLVRDHWGQYVALLRDPRGGEQAVLRDPSGMLDAMTWRLADAVDVVAADMTQLPPGLRARWPLLNWDRIAAFTAAAATATTPALFDEVEVVGPGELMFLGAARPRSEVVWNPVSFAAQPGVDATEAGQEIVRRLDRCTADLVGGYDRLIMELSGGLDSSVVAGALAATGSAGRVVEWFNAVNPRPEADESAHARAVTDRLGARLSTFEHQGPPLTVTDFTELGSSMWPASGGLDPHRDRLSVQRIEAAGAQAIVSGQGGDAAFFQMPSILVAADALKLRGPAILGDPILAEVARRTRKSAWTVLSQACAALRGRSYEDKLVSSLISPEVRSATAGVEHAWVHAARTADLPPGKRFHIRVMANTHLNHADSRRRRRADLIFPLLAQPVVELCLALPTPILAGANYDRPYEHAIFADRVPDQVLLRRMKGNLTVYVSRLVAASLGELRPFLLEGTLCAGGILDRRALERLLDPNQLIWKATPSEVLWAALVEGWVRYWQTRVPDSHTAPRSR